jgi:hypothetical protein
MSEIIQGLSLEQLERIRSEAIQNPELEASLALVSREIMRRTVEIQNNATGAYDASQDEYINPSHIDQHWQTDFYRDEDHIYIRGSN